MDIILERIEEYILSYIWFHYNHENIHSPRDIMNAVEEDALEDIKDRLWDLVKYELSYSNILDEIERRKDLDRTDDEEDEENSCCKEDSDGE